jgi:hypothetical protein
LNFLLPRWFWKIVVANVPAKNSVAFIGSNYPGKEQIGQKYPTEAKTVCSSPIWDIYDGTILGKNFDRI